MTRHMDRELHARWRQRLERQRQGSLTVAEFCERERISTATFYAWRRKLQGSACPPAIRGFVTLKQTLSSILVLDSLIVAQKTNELSARHGSGRQPVQKRVRPV